MALFCEPQNNWLWTGSCNASVAIDRALKVYEAVGITENFSGSLDLLEARLPFWFRGARAAYALLGVKNPSSQHNPLTNTTMKGYTSTKSRAILAQETVVQEDMRLYTLVRAKFFS